MRSTKLGHHLQLLSAADRKSFAKYLVSPFFDVPPRCPRLFAILENGILKAKTTALSEEATASLLFPGEPFDRNRIRKEFTYLLQHLERFLSVQAAMANPTQLRIHLLTHLNNLGDTRYFDSLANALQTQIRAHMDSADAFIQINQIANQTMAQVGKKGTRSSGLEFAGMITDIDSLYCIQRMPLLYAEMNEHMVYGKPLLAVDHAAFLELLESRLHLLPALTALYFYLYQCTINPANEQAYRKFRDLLSHAQLQAREEEDMYSAAINYAIRRLNAGQEAYLHEIFALYSELKQGGRFDTLPGMLAPHFKNAAVIACRLGEYAWAGEFIRQYATRLQEMGQGIAVDFAEGVLAYFQSELRTAARHLNKTLVEFRDVYYGLDARGYLMRIHFETDDLQALDSLADSFKMYLRRTKAIPNFRKSNYQAFIRLVLRLSRIPAHDRESLRNLRAELQNGRKIPVADWLLQQVDKRLA